MSVIHYILYNILHPVPVGWRKTLCKLQNIQIPSFGMGARKGCQFAVCASLLLVLLASCASMGSPDGGRYDEEPPKVLYCTPENKAVGADKKKISIWFDEYIKLENANDKVTVSPPQTEAPNIRADGKRVRVDLFDDLLPNTTYTVDFSDAISDNNEGNPLGLYTYSFSTGSNIDTMEVSGTVLNAADLEPVKGIMVGLYPADSTFTDSTFLTRPLSRVGRTNGSGRFSIKGVANARYRAFALQDMDGNYCYSQKSERIAFDSTSFSTSHRPDFRPDTVWIDTVHYEKIRMVPYIHYYPDNLVLLAFLEEGQDHHLLKNERLTPEKFTLFFTSPADSLPRIQGVNFDAEKSLFCEPSLHNDTITYWIPDTNVAYMDTLSIYLSYLDTDTLGNLVPRTDTLDLTPKTTHAKIEKERLKNSENWEKERQKKLRKAKEPLPYEENPYEHTYMEMQLKPGTSIDPNQNVRLLFSEPLQWADTTRVHFMQKVDSNLVEVPYLFLPDEDNPRSYTLYAEWQPKATYQLSLDSTAFVSILGHPSQPMKSEIRVRSLDEFGTIFLKLSNVGLQAGDTAYVELLNRSDKPVAKQPVQADGRVDFFYLKPGNYYLRLFIDRNGNGIWDTGDYAQQRQPEEVFYFPKPMAVRAKWDMEQAWDVRGIERDKQKPKEITKQKPDKQKNVKDRNRERDEQRAKEREKNKRN